MLYLILRKVWFILRVKLCKIYINRAEKISFDLFNIYSSPETIFQMDRTMVEPYLSEILDADRRGFITNNFLYFPERYVHKLMIAIPELLAEITYQDLIKIVNKLNNVWPIVSFLDFIQNYLGIDPYEILNTSKIHREIRRKILLEMEYRYGNSRSEKKEQNSHKNQKIKTNPKFSLNLIKANNPE